jgi:hypothetical protein
MRVLGGYLSLLVPARSAPAYEHQLHRKATIVGSKAMSCVSGIVLPIKLLSRYQIPMSNEVSMSKLITQSNILFPFPPLEKGGRGGI